MKKTSLFLLALLWIGCGGDSKIAATVDGKPIYIKDLDDAAKNQIKRVELQIYEVRKDALEDVINDKLLQKAAKEKSLSVEDFEKQEIIAKVESPADEELKAMYDARKQKDTPPFEDVKEELRSYLIRNRENLRRQQVMNELRTAAKVEIKMDAPRVEIGEGDSPAIGPKGAPITVIEFSDYQCPFCGRARATVNQITNTYGDKVRYVFRDFPLSFHKDAFLAHVAAHCAGDQNKYWEYNHTLFQNQQELKAESLKKYAKEVGLNLESFNKCLAENKYGKRVQTNIEEGSAAGVSGTPAFFVNGIALSGAQPFPRFKEIIDSELKK